jgi:3-deoxy-D-manno-octulosonic-acid transferase
LARVALDPGLLAFNLGILLLSPLLIAQKVRRVRKGAKGEFERKRWTAVPETPDRNDELQKEPGIHVVFVGSGFGEWLLMDKLGKALRDRIPDLKISLCLRDPVTVAHVLRQRPGQNVLNWPFDFLIPVLRFLGRVHPDVVVFFEKFRFTNFAVGSARYGAKVALLSGRARKRRGFVQRLADPGYRWMVRSFSAMFMQREEFAEAMRGICASGADVRATGDVKIDLQHKDIEPDRAAEIDRWLGQSPVPIFAAGSTKHTREEAILLDAWEQVRAEFPSRLMIAPRRFQRADEVETFLRERGYTVSRRSRGDGDADIYLLDTLGELAYAYRHCLAAYVGGAMFEMGHNVLEPVEWGKPVAYGRNRGNFEALQKMCEEIGVGFRVADAQELARHWLQVARDPALRDRIARVGPERLERERGTFERNLEGLIRLIEREPRTAAGRRARGFRDGSNE